MPQPDTLQEFTRGVRDHFRLRSFVPGLFASSPRTSKSRTRGDMVRVGTFLAIAAVCGFGLANLDNVFARLDDSRREREHEKLLTARATVERQRLLAAKSG